MNRVNLNNDKTISVREKILLTAHDLFYSSGFKATGVDTIIKQAKVTKVTFYRHFPGKVYLLLPISTIDTKYGLTGLKARCVDILLRVKPRPVHYLTRCMNGLFHRYSMGAPLLMPAQKQKSEENEGEIKDICRNHKTETKAKIASLTGITDEKTVNEIMMLIDGAIIHAQMGIAADEVISSLKKGSRTADRKRRLTRGTIGRRRNTLSMEGAGAEPGSKCQAPAFSHHLLPVPPSPASWHWPDQTGKYSRSGSA